LTNPLRRAGAGGPDRLVRRPQFRYYKANLAKECPYWAVELGRALPLPPKPNPAHSHPQR